MLKNNSKPQNNQKLNRTDLKNVMGGGGPINHCPEACFFDENLPGGSSCIEPLECRFYPCERGGTMTCQ
ncbi:hypothetical protein [Pedobacter caeni]|uniref:Uncharacterized protein n=1 Tax=Pedobacter caeni TaxID=288992 RepID=A0A1M4ZT08_9SPHI|nr:hypothetical protein [Pedobacter caeni]SHF21075.1 hypothetical protein SAMN04488522_102446 [Pedobacter caeni]